MLGGEIANLALADAVLAGAGAAIGQRPLDQPVEEGLHLAPLLGIGRVDQRQDVEIAVADMADDRREQARAGRCPARVALTQAASAEIGTQTSVDSTSAPGFSARAAQ